MKRIAFVREDGVGKKIRVANAKMGRAVMSTWQIKSRNWCFVTEREWNSPKFRNDEEMGEITENTLY